MPASMTRSARDSREHEILVRRYLKSARDSIFSTDNTPVSVRIIAQDLHLSQEEVHRLCRGLAARNILQEIQAGGPYPFYRMP